MIKLKKTWSVILAAVMLLAALSTPSLAATEALSEERHRNGSYVSSLGDMAGRRLYVYGIVDSFSELREDATDADIALNADAPAGRLDAALYLYRMLGAAPTELCPFSDVPQEYTEAVSWLYEAGVTRGVGNNQYGIGSITMHQLLVMLSRYFNWETEDPDALRDLAESIELLPPGIDDGVFNLGELYQILSAALDRLCPEPPVPVRPEMSAPAEIRIEAASWENAARQIEEALRYVPERIGVQFPEDCPASEIETFLLRFDRQSDSLPVFFVCQIDWCFLFPYHLTQYRGNRFKLQIPHYSSASEAFADSLDWLRVYRDERYSAALAGYRTRFLDPMLKYDSVYERVKKAHDLLCRMASYDYTEYSSGTRPQAHSLLGFLDSRRVVCDGYAKTYQWMLRCLNVESYLVSGTTSRGEHGWNKVLLDGTWYNVDACWDGRNGCLFFLKSDAFFETHDHHFLDRFSTTAYAGSASWQR